MNEARRQQKALEEWVGLDYHLHGIYGAQWGDPGDGKRGAVRDWVRENVPGRRVMEIGHGGGRWTRQYIGWGPLELVLVDGTPAAKTATEVQIKGPVIQPTYHVSRTGHVPQVADEGIDYVFSFDSFIHFDRELVETYVKTIARVLHPDGVATIHYAEGLGDDPDRPYLRFHDLDQLLLDVGLRESNRIILPGQNTIVADWRPRR